jgi:hypothetical protein
MRTVTQPGPVAQPRVVAAGGALVARDLSLPPGLTLHDAVTAPLAAAGFQGGTVLIEGGLLDPFRYVMPGPPDGPDHVAYFTAPRAPVGTTRLERANLTFGWAEGAPSLHCHAVWVEPDGVRRGGHILPRETVLAAGATARAWAFRDLRIETGFDAETNFTLFQVAAEPGDAPDAVAARVRPNVDIVSAVEAIAAGRGWADATVRGSLGSLVGACFADGRVVADLATEVLVREGRVSGGQASLDLAVVDMAGAVHEGVLARGRNAVLITFDLVLERVGPG